MSRADEVRALQHDPLAHLSPADRALAEAKIVQHIERLARGLCTVCGGHVTREVQVGRCVYADPCRHRMRQGKARSAEELRQAQEGEPHGH